LYVVVSTTGLVVGHVIFEERGSTIDCTRVEDTGKRISPFINRINIIITGKWNHGCCHEVFLGKMKNELNLLEV
jgi:hypothetical protein